jgi:hypothetical protein
MRARILTHIAQSDNLIGMKITLTEFLRSFRKAREAADRGDSVVVKGESGDYVFERRAVISDHPFAGLEDVFGAVKLPQDKADLREKVRSRLAEKNGRRRRRAA